MTTSEQHTHSPAYLLADGAGVADIWWPFSAGVGRYTHKLTGRQSEGRLFQMLVTEPRGAAPPLHVHRDADETFYVVEGEITFFAGEAQILAGAADFVFIPRGCPHTFIVRSEQARMLVTFGPAGAEEFFAELGTDAAHQPKPAADAPDPEVFATIADRYGMDIVGGPPTLD
jgi:quercetin dioxygenase-like cupin family protein